MSGLENPDTLTIVVAVIALMLGGTIKGMLGIGLPLMSMPILLHVMSLQSVISLLALPMFFSNIFQVWQARPILPNLRRFWPMMLTMATGTTLGVMYLSGADASLLYVFAGGIVITFALIDLLAIQIVLPARQEPWLAPVVGAASGVIGSMSTLFGPPMIMFLMSLNLPRVQFMGSIALAYITGPLSIILGLLLSGALTAQSLATSAMASGPVLLGMFIGNRLGGLLPQATFRRVIMGVLVVIGLNIVRKGVIG